MLSEDVQHAIELDGLKSHEFTNGSSMNNSESVSGNSFISSSDANNQAGGTIYRLKVVGIPETYSEDQLRGLFTLCGSVIEARIVHDKQSGKSVGYGYVSFSSKEAADLAISTFDDQLQLQGGATSLSVYYAKKQTDQATIEKESCPARNAKLYFCGTPAGFRRDSILALFSAFGRVRHLQVYTDSYGVLSSGTVTMYSTEEATTAMNSLDGKVLQPGTAPLKVTWAQLSTLPRRNPAGGGPPPPMPKGFTVSYACIPTSVTPSEVAALFERFGMVLQVVPFAHRREGPANSRGCGLVVMESDRSAMDTVAALSGKYTWEGAERPLLVQLFYGAERVGPHQLPTLPESGTVGSPSGQQAGGFNDRAAFGDRAGLADRPAFGFHDRPAFGYGRPAYHQHQHQHGGPRTLHRENAGGRSYRSESYEPPPPGCTPDVFKLQLMNLPASYSQVDVYSLLQPYGTVVSVLRQQGADPASDGSAVVWYATAAQADAALAALRNTVLMTPAGPRQLVVQALGRKQTHNSNWAGPACNGNSSIGGYMSANGLEVNSTTASNGPTRVVFQPQKQQQVFHLHYQQPGLQQNGVIVMPGDGDSMYQAAVATAAPAGPPGLLPLSHGQGTLDMQQLMYALPNGLGQQQGGVAAVTTGMALQGLGVTSGLPANTASNGQLWPVTASPGVIMAGQQLQLAPNGSGITNSGNVLEQLQVSADAGYLNNTGWL